ncbi:hypothetical protein, partial [Streptomyces prunicolor]
MSAPSVGLVGAVANPSDGVGLVGLVGAVTNPSDGDAVPVFACASEVLIGGTAGRPVVVGEGGSGVSGEGEVDAVGGLRHGRQPQALHVAQGGRPHGRVDLRQDAA